MDEQKRYDEGLSLRRKVLGDAYVERSIAKRNAFNTEFQALITRYAWGEVWQRPPARPSAGLPPRTAFLFTARPVSE